MPEEGPPALSVLVVVVILARGFELLLLAEHALLFVLLFDFRVLLLALLSLAPLLRGDRGRVHHRRARRVELASLDEVQPKGARLQQRQPRPHHVNLLLPRQ